MFAVLKTGGKQYKVQAGDILRVEKLAANAGDKVQFNEILMVGGDSVTVGAPTVAGATVSATLIETRKGEKVKIFKKIRRQGYRRTRGHRQSETVLRVTAIDGAGKSAKWDGKVDLTSKALLDARARNLKNVVAELEAAAAPVAEAPAKKAAPKKAAAPKAEGEAKAAPKKAAKKSDDAAE